MIEIAFDHRPSAHCENGVTRNLLHFYGYDYSEPLVFGLSASLYFVHLPFVHRDRVADQVVVAILAKDGDVVRIEMEAVFRRHIGQEVHAHHGAHGRTLSQQLVELTFGRCVA